LQKYVCDHDEDRQNANRLKRPFALPRERYVREFLNIRVEGDSSDPVIIERVNRANRILSRSTRVFGNVRDFLGAPWSRRFTNSNLGAFSIEIDASVAIDPRLANRNVLIAGVSSSAQHACPQGRASEFQMDRTSSLLQRSVVGEFDYSERSLKTVGN